MEKSKRLISVGVSTARRLCTTAEVGLETRRSEPVNFESFRHTLSMLGATGESVDQLKNCVKEPLKFNFKQHKNALLEPIGLETRQPEPINSGSLCHRLAILGATDESVASATEKYFLATVKELRRYKHHQKALELVEWMEKRGISLSYRDYGVKVDLLAKTQGINSAEKYFNSLSPFEQNKVTYCALLNCYCKEKMADKAMALFKKMDELFYVDIARAYNYIMTLYMRSNEPEKVPPLVQEMKGRKIPMDTFTYNLLMNSYACLKDIDGVERVIVEVETKDSDKCDWTIYSNAAIIYIDVRLFDKAESALKKLEEKIPPQDRRPYHFLISLYARTKNLSEVHRVWISLKSAFRITNNLSYRVVLQALAKLNDLGSMKEFFEEWLSGYSHYDIRLANALVGVYLRRNMIKEAELLVEDAVKRGSGLNFQTHEMFMDYYLTSCQIDLALKSMENAVFNVEENRWKPSLDRTRAFFEYFEKEKDVNGAEKFCKMLKKVNGLNAEAYKLLLCTYVAASRTEPMIRQRMKADGIKISTEVEDLLARVCPE